MILGNYSPEENNYHKSVFEAASEEVEFVGAIYDSKVVDALRFYAKLYVHGHQVGGTNPSLVEAIGAGNAVLAHDNKFNRWVARDGGIYFNGVDDADDKFNLLFNSPELVEKLQRNSRKSFIENFRWQNTLEKYEQLFLRFS